MKTKIFTALLVVASFVQAQQTTTQVNKLEEVIVSAEKANDSLPISFTEILPAQFAPLNLGQDLPVLLNFQPSVVSTTYDGTGVGYTDYRIRGADNSRINVTINGIPYNDADSQTTFFVNLQDFASSLEGIQIQRGVGTSTNGAASFGASVQLQTEQFQEDAYYEFNYSTGSFGTQRKNIKFSTGLLENGFSFNGRLSKVETDGYVDRAFADLKSYYLNGSYRSGNTALSLVAFGGTERTGLSFFGLDKAGLEQDRTVNYDGLYFDAQGNYVAYEDQTDNYQQDHLQLHWNQKFNSDWRFRLSLHHTNGAGYFEQIQDDVSTYNYRITDLANSLTTDLATQAYLNSEFYGGIFNLQQQKTDYTLTFGGGFNRYLGEQYGLVKWADVAVLPSPNFEFYRNTSDKFDSHIYTKLQYRLSEKWNAFTDLQYRAINYAAKGSLVERTGQIDVDENYGFFNPKLGIDFKASESTRIYASFARANREPARVDFENGNPEAEQLDDFEFGFRLNQSKLKLNANVYYMNYENQLVLTGALDEVGFPIRQNVGSSYRFGLEVDAVYPISSNLTWRPAIALSTNKNRNFVDNKNGSLVDLSDTAISYSPNLIASHVLAYEASEKFTAYWFFKHVGEQYMSNTEAELSVIDAYSVHDLSFDYELNSNLKFQLLVNNVFDLNYENNGYFYSYDIEDNGAVTTFYGNAYYPQAGRNYMLGMSLRF